MEWNFKANKIKNYKTKVNRINWLPIAKCVHPSILFNLLGLLFCKKVLPSSIKLWIPFFKLTAIETLPLFCKPSILIIVTNKTASELVEFVLHILNAVYFWYLPIYCSIGSEVNPIEMTAPCFCFLISTFNSCFHNILDFLLLISEWCQNTKIEQVPSFFFTIF